MYSIVFTSQCSRRSARKKYWGSFRRGCPASCRRNGQERCARINTIPPRFVKPPIKVFQTTSLKAALFELHLQGLLSDGERKNVEATALKLDGPERKAEKVSNHSVVRFVRFLASAISETLPPITLSFHPNKASDLYIGVSAFIFLPWSWLRASAMVFTTS